MDMDTWTVSGRDMDKDELSLPVHVAILGDDLGLQSTPPPACLIPGTGYTDVFHALALSLHYIQLASVNPSQLCTSLVGFTLARPSCILF